MAASWRGELILDRGWLLYDGPAAPTSAHAHHAVQLILASATPIEIIAPSGRHLTRHAIIPADRTHAIGGGSPRVVILYLAPESPLGRELAMRLRGADDAGAWANAGAMLDGVVGERTTSWEAARRVVTAVTERLATTELRQRPWPRAIEQVVAALPEQLDRAPRLSAFATAVGLSESRLSHLFTAHVGIPFRAYVLWVRLERAASELARGRNLTEAAHTAGFADSAHLSRSFRKMFGIAPSALTAVATWRLKGHTS